MSGAHLVQILLPLAHVDGSRFPSSFYRDIARELTRRFGGMTAYNRAPAAGLWEERPGRTEHDEIVVYEVMVDTLDAQWWADYRRGLAARFEQQDLVVRAQPMRRL